MVVATAPRRQPVWQGGGGAAKLAIASQVVVAAIAQHWGTLADTVMLPPREAAMVMKTPMATAMAGAQTTISNQLETVTATATEMTTMTVTTMTIETKATVAAEAWQHCVGGSQLGGSSSLAIVQHWRHRQRQVATVVFVSIVTVVVVIVAVSIAVAVTTVS